MKKKIFTKFKQDRFNYIKNITNKINNMKVSKTTIINENMFSLYIARGNSTFKEFILDEVLEGKIYKDKTIHLLVSQFDDSDINNLVNKYKENIRLNEVSQVVDYDKYSWLKFLEIKNIEGIENYLNINLSNFKTNYNNYKNIILKLKTTEEIYNFLNSERKKFTQYYCIELNIDSLLKIMNIPKNEKENIKNNVVKFELIKKQELINKTNEKNKVNNERKINKHLQLINSFAKKTTTTYKNILEIIKHKHTLLSLNNEKLTDLDLIKYLGLEKSSKIEKERQKYLNYDLPIQQLLSKYRIHNEKLIHNMYVTDILNITATELNRWKDCGKISIAESKQFNKWGKTLSSDYFDPKYLLSIKQDTIDSWRIEDTLVRNISKSDTKLTPNVIKKLHDKNYLLANNKWYTLVEIELDTNISIKSLMILKISNEFKKGTSFNKALEILSMLKEQLNTNSLKIKIKKKINSYELTSEHYHNLIKYLSETTINLDISEFKENTINANIEIYLKSYLEKKVKNYIQESIKLNVYENSFPLARSLDRNIKIITGPTNSGKTYDALQDLMLAESGVYLAPLRLLAMEIYDKLNLAGIPCNLITGEEKIILPNAKHTSSTIEMMDHNNVVDVAIIDEFQMLDDIQRGWAWTQAMAGVPAKKLYVIGNSSKTQRAIDLYTLTNERYEILEKERFNKLEPLEYLIDVKELVKGDAIIAFSRKDVLSYASIIKSNNLKVSIIYGSLSPEVRRRQAELFNSGETDVLVSTDAIGMGLNLPIKRIIFATVKKFDGNFVRSLEVSELLQIAGRAGRYDVHECGYVGALANNVNTKETISFIKECLDSRICESKSLLSIAPNNWHIEFISKTLKTKNLLDVLHYFYNLNYGIFYKPANLAHMTELYKIIKPHIQELDLTEQYKLISAPVSPNETEVIDLYLILIQQVKKNEGYRFSYNHPSSLEDAEIKSKKLSLYSWLSFHYDCLDNSKVSITREILSLYIEKKLLTHFGVEFSMMIIPKTQQKYRNEFSWQDDEEDNY